MMKKFLRTALLAAMALSLASGCSLFASGGGDKGTSGSSGAIQMTDGYSFQDPADLDFDTRYVLHCDENSTALASLGDYGTTGLYSIMYAKEDAPAGSYDFYICDTAEHAAALADYVAAAGTSMSILDEDPCIIYTSSDADTLEAIYLSFQSYGIITEPTVSAYVEFYKSNMGAVLME